MNLLIVLVSKYSIYFSNPYIPPNFTKHTKHNNLNVGNTLICSSRQIKFRSKQTEDLQNREIHIEKSWQMDHNLFPTKCTQIIFASTVRYFCLLGYKKILKFYHIFRNVRCNLHVHEKM